MSGVRRGRLAVMVAVGMAAALGFAGLGTATAGERPLRAEAGIAADAPVPLGEQPAVRSQPDELLSSGAIAGPRQDAGRPPSDRPSAGSGAARRATGRSRAELAGLAAGRFRRGRSPPGRGLMLP